MTPMPPKPPVKPVAPRQSRKPAPASGKQAQKAQSVIKNSKASAAAKYIAAMVMLPEKFANGAALVRGPAGPDHPGKPTAICIVKTERALTFDASDESKFDSGPALNSAIRALPAAATAVEYQASLVLGSRSAALLSGSGYDDLRDLADLTSETLERYRCFLGTGTGATFPGVALWRSTSAPYDRAPIHNVNGPVTGRGPRARSGDTLTVIGFTTDTTASNIVAFAVWLLVDGTRSAVNSTATTGSAGIAACAAITAPSNTVALLEFGFRATATAACTLTAVQATLTRAAVLTTTITTSSPVGSPSGEDLSFFLENAVAHRILGHGVRCDPQDNRDFNGQLAMCIATDPYGPESSVNEDYASVASTTSSLTGDAVDGGYAFAMPTPWMKTSSEDVTSRITGFVSSLTANPSVRLVTFTVIEYVPRGQTVETQYNPCNAVLWNHAMQLVRSAPRIYENPSHADDISAFLINVGNTFSRDLAAAAQVVPSMATEFNLAALGVHSLASLGSSFAKLFS